MPYSLGLPIEADSWACTIDTGGGEALRNRDDFESTLTEFGCHRDLDCGKRYGDEV